MGRGIKIRFCKLTTIHIKKFVLRFAFLRKIRYSKRKYNFNRKMGIMNEKKSNKTSICRKSTNWRAR